MSSEIYIALSDRWRSSDAWKPSPTTWPTRRQPAFVPSMSASPLFLASGGSDTTAYTKAEDGQFLTRSGPIVATGNRLDVAIQGDGFLSIQTPAGTAYTRDGRIKVSADGQLQSVNGYPILDVGGAPIRINLANGPVAIAANGAISQNEQALGRLGCLNCQRPPNCSATITRRS